MIISGGTHDQWQLIVTADKVEHDGEFPERLSLSIIQIYLQGKLR